VANVIFQIINAVRQHIIWLSLKGTLASKDCEMAKREGISLHINNGELEY
jgi:hypothetical protein